jgi:hypothetical protein
MNSTLYVDRIYFWPVQKNGFCARHDEHLVLRDDTFL